MSTNTDQTAAQTDEWAELAAEADAHLATVHEIRAEIDRVTRPLRAQLDVAFAQFQAARELMGETADTPARMVASAGSRAGSDRLRETLRGLHPAIIGTTSYGPSDHEGCGRLRGPNLAVDRDADEAYTTELAGVLVQATTDGFFAVVPADDKYRAEYEGLVFAEVLAHDCGEFHSWTVTFSPDGSEATLRDRRMVDAEGDLVSVLSRLVKSGWYQDPKGRDCDCCNRW